MERRLPRGCVAPRVSSRMRGWGVPVASVLGPTRSRAEPGHQRSAGEYCGGDPTGGEAAASTTLPAEAGAFQAGADEAGRAPGRTEADSQELIAHADSAPRGGAAAARWAHNPKVGGSNPPPRYHRTNETEQFCVGSLLLFLARPRSVSQTAPSCCTTSSRSAVVSSGQRSPGRTPRTPPYLPKKVPKPFGDVAQSPQQIGCVLVVVPFLDQTELAILALVELEPAAGRPNAGLGSRATMHKLRLGNLASVWCLIIPHCEISSGLSPLCRIRSARTK